MAALKRSKPQAPHSAAKLFMDTGAAFGNFGKVTVYDLYSKEYWQAMKEAAEQQVTNIRNLALMKQSDRPSDLKYQSQINRELKKLVLEVAQADVNIRNAELTAALQGQELGSNILKTKRRFDYGLMTPTKQLSQLAEDVDLEIENVMLKLTGGSLVPADIDWSQFRDNYVKTQLRVQTLILEQSTSSVPKTTLRFFYL